MDAPVRWRTVSGGSRSSRKHGSSIEPRGDERIPRVLDDPRMYELFGLIGARVVEATATSLSRYMGLPHAEITRRLAVLEHSDLVEPVVAARGGEAVYRTTRDALLSDEDLAHFSPAHRRRLLSNALRVVDGRIWSALELGGFDAHDAHLSWTPLDLDVRGYEDMVRLALETLERARDIQAEVVQRRAEGVSDDAGAYTDLVILHFRREGGETVTPAAAATELREEIYRLSEDVADGLASAAPDMTKLAARARELAALAERLATATARGA